MEQTELTRRLIAHRAGHPECDRHCADYLAIALELTALRVIYEGPRTPYRRLSVQEA